MNSGNEAIDKTNMRGQQTKIHYLAISKHAPSSRAIKALDNESFGLHGISSFEISFSVTHERDLIPFAYFFVSEIPSDLMEYLRFFFNNFVINEFL